MFCCLFAIVLVVYLCCLFAVVGAGYLVGLLLVDLNVCLIVVIGFMLVFLY